MGQSAGKFKMNRAGFIAALKSDDVGGVIEAHTQRIKAGAGMVLPADAAPFEADVRVGKNRVRGMVKTSTDRGTPGFRNRQATVTRNALLKGV